MELGTKIRRLREKHGLKQVNLANALQVSPQAVSKWEKGVSYPDIESIIKIARLFNVSTDYLLGITDKNEHIFEATVFLTGIIGFAKRSLKMKPEDLVYYSNSMFFALTEITLRNDGVPVKYMGDGFLAFYSGPDQIKRALDTAISAKESVYKSELIVILNTGNIYLGLIGHPGYASKDILGDTVNRAFFIKAWAEDNLKPGIFITEETRKKIDVDLNTSKENIHIDLLNEDITIYELF